MRYAFILLLTSLLGLVVSPTLAQETSSEAVDENTAVENVKTEEAADFKKRLEISRELHKIKPVREQVDNAVDGVASRLPQAQQDVFRSRMRAVLNYNSIRNISINAMAETFTVEELQAMLEYNKKPEAQSAEKKLPDYQDKIRPEIVRMIDKAIMRMRTGEEQ